MSRYKILIADDDEDQHEILSGYLSVAGYEVGHVYSGREALDFFERGRPDVLLLDVRMPELDGFGTLAALQSNPEYRSTPVLMLTSLNQSNLKVKGLEMGADDYIAKPFNKAELLARIRAALRRSGRYARNLAALEGDLRDVDLPELLQTFEISGAAAKIRLHDLDGEICVRAGALLEVRFGGFSGMDAFNRMIMLNRGLFSVTFGGAESASEGELMGIRHGLMNALTLIDEALAQLSSIGSPDTIVELDDDLPAEGLPAEFAGFGPLALREILALIPGDLRARAEQLEQLARRSLVRQVT